MVECINNEGFHLKLTIGKIYKILNKDKTRYIIEANDGSRGDFYKWRFKLLTEKIYELWV